LLVPIWGPRVAATLRLDARFVSKKSKITDLLRARSRTLVARRCRGKHEHDESREAAQRAQRARERLEKYAGDDMSWNAWRACVEPLWCSGFASFDC
jgi:hypothetical protein